MKRALGVRWEIERCVRHRSCRDGELIQTGNLYAQLFLGNRNLRTTSRTCSGNGIRSRLIEDR